MKRGDRWVVDTNVPIVANGINDANNKKVVSLDCRLAAVEFLVALVERGITLLDAGGEIQQEYGTYLNYSGAPGVGDRFFQEVVNSHPDRVLRLNINKNVSGEYENLPVALVNSAFDQSDRKFAAVALAGNGTVANAVDNDWINSRAVLQGAHVQVLELCGCDPSKWFQ